MQLCFLDLLWFEGKDKTADIASIFVHVTPRSAMYEWVADKVSPLHLNSQVQHDEGFIILNCLVVGRVRIVRRPNPLAAPVRLALP